MKPLVLYHAGCWDGFCAAWIADRALGGAEAIPVHYGTPPPNVTDREVFILDFSYPRPILLTMKQSAYRVMVLDHHKSAKEELAGLPFCTFEDDKSGGRMAWEYFYTGPDGRIPKSPWLVDYTEDRDLWRHKLPDSEAINACLRSYPLDFDLWDRFLLVPASTFINEGNAIRRREKQIVDEHVRHAREVEMDGHKILICNATVLYSEIAGELAKGRPFGAVYFDRHDGKRVWSLRSADDGVDVSAIAKSHGGGGHKHAAGFEV